MSDVILIDFMAEWCGPCKMQDPIIDEMKKKFEGKVEFKKVDIDSTTDEATKYKIMAVPTLVIEKDGVVLNKFIGLTRLTVLEKALNDALQ